MVEIVVVLFVDRLGTESGRTIGVAIEFSSYGETGGFSGIFFKGLGYYSKISNTIVVNLF